MNYSDIQKLLRSNNLQSTFPFILQKVRQLGKWELEKEVERLWDTYQQMMIFMLQGVQDPQSERIREDICQRLHTLVTRISRQERIQTAPTVQYAVARNSLRNISSFETIVSHLENLSKVVQDFNNDTETHDSIRQNQFERLAIEHEMAVQQLFDWTWTSDMWQNADIAQANRIIFSDDIASNDKSVFIASVTLSLFEYLDYTKLLFLLDSYLVEDEQVSQRALVGFLLIIHIYYQEVHLNQDLKDRMSVYQDNDTFRHDIFSAMMQLEMSCTTEGVTSKMRNDILPALMKGFSKGQNPATIDINTLAQNGENPEWMDDEKTNKKMREMAQLQMDGSDVYFASFSTLKSHSFFHQMVHWFYIFSDHSPALVSHNITAQNNKLVQLMLKGSPFCNSDKYSLLFTLSSIGGVNEEALTSQVSSMLPDDVSEDELMESLNTQKSQKADIRRHYILDLYRFYHLYLYRNQFTNPFQKLKENPITPLHNDLLSELVEADRGEMIQYADFLMLKGFYVPALQLYKVLIEEENVELELHQLSGFWQKTGFCHQKLHNEQEAIEAYTIANEFKPNSKWTLTHLAELLYKEGHIKESSTYYQQLIEISPDRQEYLLMAATVYYKLHQYEKALAIYYKIVFLNEDTLVAKLQLIRTLLLLNRKDEAAKQIHSLEVSDPLLNETKLMKALFLLTNGNRQEAFNLLKPLSLLPEEDYFEFLDRLQEQELLDSDTVTLFKDAIKLIDTQA